MARPKTLLQLAGAPASPASLERAALLLIDCQEEYVRGGLPLAGVEAAIDAIARVLSMARASETPIIHVVHHGHPGGLFDPTGANVRIAEQASAREGEAIIVKQLPNAFARTELEQTLARTGRREIILAGFMTHMCVSTTARAALDLGFRTTVLADACATRDLPDATGHGVIEARQIHAIALAELADRFAVVVKRPEDLLRSDA